MRLITDRNDQIKDFTMQYRYDIPGADELLLVRADYGHGPKYPHMDVEIISNKNKKKKKKLINVDIIQNQKFPSYEYVINMVLMQAEKFEPEVGAKYCISPTQIHTNRISYIKSRWQEEQGNRSSKLLL